MKKFIETYAKDKKAEEVFTDQYFYKNNLMNYPPEYRTELFTYFSNNNKNMEKCDSERGINGMTIIGGAVVWNKEEYDPWDISNITSIFGVFTVEGTLYIISKALLFVGINIEVENLIVSEGELHVLGKIIVKNSFIIAKESYVHANEINTKNIGLFGKVKCNNIKFKNKFIDQRSIKNSIQN